MCVIIAFNEMYIKIILTSTAKFIKKLVTMIECWLDKDLFEKNCTDSKLLNSNVKK